MRATGLFPGREVLLDITDLLYWPDDVTGLPGSGALTANAAAFVDTGVSFLGVVANGCCASEEAVSAAASNVASFWNGEITQR